MDVSRTREEIRPAEAESDNSGTGVCGRKCRIQYRSIRDANVALMHDLGSHTGIGRLRLDHEPCRAITFHSIARQLRIQGCVEPSPGIVDLLRPIVIRVK